MDCRQCSNNLSAYLDGELLSSFEQEVVSHLQSCAACAQDLREMEAAAEFVDAHADDLELDPKLWNNLRTRVAPMPVPQQTGLFSRLWARNRWLTATAAVAATAVLAFALFAYVDYLERQEIEKYMSDYILEREEEQVAERRTDAIRTNEAEETEFIEMANPFAAAKPVSFQNPFR
jgi:hypothetical protein